MKRWITVGVIVCVLLTAAGLAQTFYVERGMIEVPFPFVAGQATLPAGTYLVSENASTHQLMFRNVESGSSVFVFANPRDIDISRNPTGRLEKTEAVFVPDDTGRQVLHQVWFPGDNHGNDLSHEKGIPEPR